MAEFKNFLAGLERAARSDPALKASMQLVREISQKHMAKFTEDERNIFTVARGSDDNDDDDDDEELDPSDSQWIDDDEDIDALLEDEEFPELYGNFMEYTPVENKVEMKAYQVERNTITSVAANIPITAGAIDILAKPGSGKTSILPKTMSQRTAVVVAVSSESNLANVGMNIPTARLVGGNTIRHGDEQLQYTTKEKLLDNFDPEPGIVIVVDEAQSDDDTNLKLCEIAVDRWAHTNPVVLVKGTDNTKMEVPDNIEIKPLCKYERVKDTPGKMMIVHRDAETFYEANRGRNHFLLINDLRKDSAVFKKIAQLEEFKLFCTYETALGLDLDLDVIYNFSSRTIDGRVKFMNDAEIYQMILRVGRRGRVGKYYGRELANTKSRQRFKFKNPPKGLAFSFPNSPEPVFETSGVSVIPAVTDTKVSGEIEGPPFTVKSDNDRMVVEIEPVINEITFDRFMVTNDHEHLDSQGYPRLVDLFGCEPVLVDIINKAVRYPSNDTYAMVLFDAFVNIWNTAVHSQHVIDGSVGNRVDIQIRLYKARELINRYGSKVSMICDGVVRRGWSFNKSRKDLRRLIKFRIKYDEIGKRTIVYMD